MNQLFLPENADYLEFLRAKAEPAEISGFVIDPSEVNPWFQPFQRDIIVWAVEGGCRALFKSFGLGKTGQQLEIVRLILKCLGGEGRGLIVMPLGVRAEFFKDAGSVTCP